MTKTPEAVARQEERTQRRREQVLTAAEICFQREGFHAASVNRIAAEADMSVGHVYRYFESKEEIIHALCERKFENYIHHAPWVAARKKLTADALIKAALDDFETLIDQAQARYVMDVFAEAGRSEPINEIVADHDRRLRANARALLEPYFSAAQADELDCRAEMIVLVLEGLMMRTVGNPTGDVKRLRRAFQYLLQAVFKPSAHSVTSLKPRSSKRSAKSSAK